MINKSELIKGMTVRSADGDRLGTLVAVDDEGFQVEKGIFFPKEYLASFEQVDQISNGDVYLKWGTHMVDQQYDALYGEGSYRTETEDEGLWSDYNSSTSYFNQSERNNRVRISRSIESEDQSFTIPVTRVRKDEDLHPC